MHKQERLRYELENYYYCYCFDFVCGRNDCWKLQLFGKFL